MKVVSDQDLRVATLSGAIVLLQAGVERELSDDIATAAMALGAKQVGTSESIVINEEVVVEEELTAGGGPDPELVEALEKLIELGNPDDFKADGTPKAQAVNRAAGRTVRTDEREVAWEQALNS